MKLTPVEVTDLNRQAADIEAGRAGGVPGSRAAPMSYAALVRERWRRLPGAR